jgi:hypothetical protein
MDEHILSAVSRLNEAISLLAVEPLYGSLRHKILLSGCAYALRVDFGPRSGAQPVRIEFWGRSLVRRKARGEAKSISAEARF